MNNKTHLDLGSVQYACSRLCVQCRVSLVPPAPIHANARGEHNELSKRLPSCFFSRKRLRWMTIPNAPHSLSGSCRSLLGGVADGQNARAAREQDKVCSDSVWIILVVGKYKRGRESAPNERSGVSRAPIPSLYVLAVGSLARAKALFKDPRAMAPPRACSSTSAGVSAQQRVRLAPSNRSLYYS